MEKTDIQNINIKSYTYDLPDERIAKYPLANRDESKLLLYKGGEITDSVFRNISEELPPNSTLVFNNTKVIQARLVFHKSTGARIEIFCLEPHLPAEYQANFEQRETCSWKCLVGNARKWKEGELEAKIQLDGSELLIKAYREKTEAEANIIRFEWDDANVSFAEILEKLGELPIPPYLNRNTEESDMHNYQTVYSKIEGSVAAPTAGLHFTDDVLYSIEERGIGFEEITLHVGAGTFRPVKSEQIGEHEMHAEFISIKKEFIENLLNSENKVIAVGTTSVRTLESLYYIGEKLENRENFDCSHFVIRQWEPYQTGVSQITGKKALANILEYLKENNKSHLLASTQIMIVPAYVFKIVEGIITNFHQPQSTLLLLIAAFVGEENWETIYKHALNNNYRFLSYGDSSFLQK